MRTLAGIPPRYFEREFGVEFTPYELKRKEEIKNAIIRKSKEISGYVRWLPAPNAFVIMPTITAADPHIACLIEPWSTTKIPPERSFINAKGSWRFWPKGELQFPSQRFVIEDYEITRPDIGEMKPDIAYNDYKEILFEGLFDVDEETQDLIAHSFVSSPTSFGRTGGLSLSLYNEYDREKKAGVLQKYLMTFLPKEVLTSQNYELTVDGSQRVLLDPFNWSYKSYDTDSLSYQDAYQLLDRTSGTLPLSEEMSISLFSKDNKPKSLKEPSASLADTPIVVERKIERGRGIFDPDPKIFQFIVATHVVQATLSDTSHKRTLDYIDEELRRLRSEHPILEAECGKGMILDLNIHGKPLSLLHLGLSAGRSNLQPEVTFETAKNAVSLFTRNLDNVMVIWEEAYPKAKELNLAGIAPEERKILGFIIRHGPSSKEDAFEYCKSDMTEYVFDRMWKSLHDGGVIYHKGEGIFDTVPYLRDLR